jgi:hypothetical protein
MELFLKVVREDPIIFRADYLEAYFAEGTKDEISWPLVSLEGDIGITDRAFQFFRHGWPPSSLIEIFLFEIQKKIKSRKVPSGSTRERRRKRLIFLLHPDPYLYENDGVEGRDFGE